MHGINVCISMIKQDCMLLNMFSKHSDKPVFIKKITHT
jgi:hypothetical protein